MLTKILSYTALIVAITPLVLMTQIPVASGWIWQYFNIVAGILAGVAIFTARDLPDTQPPLLAGFALFCTAISFVAIGMYFMYV